MASTFLAVRIGDDGVVRLGDQVLIGDPGTWVVLDPVFNRRDNWPDDRFRETFEPLDEQAKDYLARVWNG